MKIVVFATHKGGDGKTTSSILYSESTAIVITKRTLIIDIDPQGNISARHLKMTKDKIPPLHPTYNAAEDHDWDGRSSIAGIFTNDGVLPYPTDIINLEIAPSHGSLLQDVEAVTKQDVVEKVHMRLKRFLDLEEVRECYDIVVIDTPPSKGPLTIAAIKAATHIVIPTQMEQFSMEGIYGMLQLWKQETYTRKDNPLHLVGILPNQVKNIKLHSQFLESLKNTNGIGKYVMPFNIKDRAIYSEILAEGAKPKSIFELPTNHVAREECLNVCNYISERVFDNG